MGALNLAGFKKIKEDKKTATMIHSSGHKLVIAKAALPPIHRKALERLPLCEGGAVKMAEGGDPVQDIVDSATNDVTRPDPKIAAQEAAYNQGRPGVAEAASDPAQQEADRALSNDFHTNPNATTTSDIPGLGQPVVDQSKIQTPAPPDTSGNNLQALYNQGQKAITENQALQTKQSAENADILKSDLDARQDLADNLKKTTAKYQEDRANFLKDFAAGHIDPKHYQESMGSGQKVATAIGLLLGGFSTPFTHQGNPALEFLNKQIDRDIESQKENIGQKRQLYEANRQAYGDDIIANNATRVNMNDIRDHQIQLAAAKNGSAAAKAAADAAHSQFGLQNAQLLQQNALRSTVLHSLKSGGQGLDAIDLAHAGLAPEADAIKEQQSVNAQKTAIDSTKNLFNQMNKEQSTYNLANPQSYRRVDALNAELVNTVMNASASKRLTRESIEAEIKPLEIKTTDTQESRQAKLDGVLNIIGKHADPTPILSKYAPKAVPEYPYNRAPTFTVGQDIIVKGKPAQIIDNKGNYRFK